MIKTNINYLKISQILITTFLFSIVSSTLFTNVAKAKPSNKALKTKLKISSLEVRESQSLDLHLTFSRVTADTVDTEEFEQQNTLELSDGEEKVPLYNQPLIASTFGGQASWYGPGFHGRLTANGERYNQNALTAAHRYLKFGTRVRVTNLNNGRSVVVRINDRGPYAKGRVIDVSAAAARSLGMIRAGVVPVKVRILGR